MKTCTASPFQTPAVGSLLMLLVVLSSPLDTSAAETIERNGFIYPKFTRATTAASIGKASSYPKAASKTLTVQVPIDAEIHVINAAIGNKAFGKGESDYGSPGLSNAPINGYEGQSGEWHKSWAKATLVEKGTTGTTQFVTVKFESWKHDNSRHAPLEVVYYYPSQGRKKEDAK